MPPNKRNRKLDLKCWFVAPPANTEFCVHLEEIVSPNAEEGGVRRTAADMHEPELSAFHLMVGG